MPAWLGKWLGYWPGEWFGASSAPTGDMSANLSGSATLSANLVAECAVAGSRIVTISKYIKPVTPRKRREEDELVLFLT